jgi:tetratricopeptide (TPR) repeat protein
VSGRTIPPLDAARLPPVYEGRGLVWTLQTKYDEAIVDFQMMRQMARAAGNPHKTSLGFVHQVRGNLREADRKLEESLQISRREGYKDSLSQNLLWLSAHAYWQGDSQRAIQLGQEGLAVAREIHDGLSELIDLAFLPLAYWSAGDYAHALSVLREGMTKAKERENRFIVGRLMNTLGWFHSEFGAVSRAIDYDYESMELGRSHAISNVEISALINLGLDHIALGQYERARSYFEPTLDRMQREAFGAHRWRWKVRLLIGLAELFYTTGAYEQALHYVEEGLKEARTTSAQKYVAKGLALRGKILGRLGHGSAAGGELQQAFTLAEQLDNPRLFYPIAYDLGQWYESAGQEQHAAMLYGKAKATIEHMATAVEDQALRSIFLQSAPVQAILERVARTGI